MPPKRSRKISKPVTPHVSANQSTYFPLNLISWLHETDGSHLVLPLILVFTILIKWRKGQEPIHGDFEAQRHWIEITYHLPINMWYRYDLKYWGLDYPPLTAYHSLIMGEFANAIQPSWIALDTSRGIESESLTVFMRATALITEYLIYVPALIMFVRNSWYRTRQSQDLWILLVLMQPALMIIDHGHFQYNSAMLGLSLLAIACFASNRYLYGAASFVAAIFFKQMALYYALPIFAWLLGRCVGGGSQRSPSFSHGFKLFIELGISVLITTTILLSPFLVASSPLDELAQILHRVFPIERGLFEDKVASFWCALNVIIKLRTLFSTQLLLGLSTGCTLLALAIPCVNAFVYPWSLKRLVYGLTASSLTFFLFSYHVHEKSILLAVMPVTLLVMEEGAVAVWFNNVAMFSMWHLIQKDGLQLPYFGILTLFNFFTWSYFAEEWNGIRWRIVVLSHLLLASLHALEYMLPPPERYPHIHVVGNVLVSAAHFCGFLVYFTWRMVHMPPHDEIVDRKKDE
ncbi:hypothetical protein SmJEL517_g04622 [Synchytrium microbalum]|uniref:Alpha-1,3-glucosyltransferase n=1 Tax=Synchytrium microbalum TaxID=1806994 RepID=A0A507BYM5_9FUNG|nr:uncharacterized protein SmJEL517_g04622 [Synchytrium microbalum]TPX32211.1 hypothetical protein SmJEL517_g04622 [Synchytrium microbalum]